MVPLDMELQWGNIKQKSFWQIQAYTHIFRHIPTYSGSCVTLAYSESWYIQNPGIFRITGIFGTL